MLLLCVVLSGHSTFAQEKHPATRSHHHSYLWLDRDFHCDDDLIAAIRRLGITGTNVAGTAPSEVQARHRIPFYVDHVAGKGFFHLKDEVWGPLETAWRDDPELEPRPRPLSLRSPEALQAVRDRMKKVLAGVKDRGPIGLALDDEIGIGRRNIPIDLGFEEAMLAAFRAELRDRYLRPEALAEAWETAVLPFEEVVPFSTQKIREREFLKEISRQNFAPWAEYREFLDAEFARVLGEFVRDLRLDTDAVPIGFTGGEAPHPFSGVDWARMLEIVDFCEPYDVGGSRELVRSLARPGTTILRTLFEDDRHPRANEHELWDYFLRGDAGTIIWAASRCFAAPDRLEPSAWALRLAPVLRRIGAADLEDFARGRIVEPRIAILESMSSNRIHWMFDSRSDGRSWVHRLSSYEKENSSQNVAREAWQKLLEDLQLDYRHIAARQLDRRNLTGIDVLILPRSIALSDAEGRILRDFARRGTLIADCQTGLFDEKGRARQEGLLDDLFGIERRNRLVNLREARPLRRGDEGPQGLACAEPGLATQRGVGGTLRFGEVPAMVIRRHGERGRSVYLNLLVHDYLGERLRGGGRALLDELRGVFRLTGVRAAAELRARADGLPPLRIVRRRGLRHDYLALLWNWRQSARALDADELARLETTEIDLLLPHATVVDFIVGRDGDADERERRPRRRSSLRIAVDPFRPTIIRLERRGEDVRDR